MKPRRASWRGLTEQASADVGRLSGAELEA